MGTSQVFSFSAVGPFMTLKVINSTNESLFACIFLQAGKVQVSNLWKKSTAKIKQSVSKAFYSLCIYFYSEKSEISLRSVLKLGTF